MSIFTMSNELLKAHRLDTIRRLESALNLVDDLNDKLADVDTEVARRARFAAPPWDEASPWDTLEEESSDVV
jgi:hypothetical protein